MNKPLKQTIFSASSLPGFLPGHLAVLLMGFLTGFVLIFSSDAFAESSDNQNSSVQASDSYVRTVPPGQKNTGVFMTLTNVTASAKSIVNAKSSAAEIVELHTHINEDGMMRMRQIEKIDIPAKGMTILKPGGLHVMLIGLKQEIVEGKPVGITLEYENGETQEIQAIGKKLKMKMPKMGMKH